MVLGADLGRTGPRPDKAQSPEYQAATQSEPLGSGSGGYRGGCEWEFEFEFEFEFETQDICGWEWEWEGWVEGGVGTEEDVGGGGCGLMAGGSELGLDDAVLNAGIVWSRCGF